MIRHISDWCLHEQTVNFSDAHPCISNKDCTKSSDCFGTTNPREAARPALRQRPLQQYRDMDGLAPGAIGDLVATGKAVGHHQRIGCSGTHGR